jgi:hypothetical protein
MGMPDCILETNFSADERRHDRPDGAANNEGEFHDFQPLDRGGQIHQQISAKLTDNPAI